MSSWVPRGRAVFAQASSNLCFRISMSILCALFLMTIFVYQGGEATMIAKSRTSSPLPCVTFMTPFTRKMTSRELSNLASREGSSHEPLTCSRYKYAVHAPPFKDTSGGIMVLYNFASRLRSLGCSVSMTGPAGGPDPWNIPIRPSSDVFKDPNTVVIYPEIVLGNPLMVKRFAHWLLYYLGVIGGAFEYSERDVIMAYASWDIADAIGAPGVPHPVKTPHQILVQASDWGLHLRTQTTAKPAARKTSYYLVKKGAKIWPKDSLERNISAISQIAQPLPQDFFSPVSFCNLMQNTEYFFTYDAHTYYSVLASLCGSTSVVLLPRGMNSDSVKKLLPWTRQGIAFGMHEVKWARETAHDLRKFMECVEQYTQASVRFFVNMTQEWDLHFPI